ncbi:Fanconi anemia group A protein isoform X1 [Electrophorus electricus]|uniref:Fanconi anemia group A protein isoform X1 n=1 Tax=Electrophorus electricus TaxID=8005 RepID=UPI0015CFD40C|nr:Fanconi anemia group A protein isoform X1 [Electrophorus electricus]XP_026886041.2 Fanconi anemia group A protein isoform X1 [Electrophorus electricus]
MSLEELSASQYTQTKTFASLIAHRDVKRRRLQSKQELHEAALQLLIQNQNLLELFRETASGSKTGENGCDQRTKDVHGQTAVGKIGISLLERELRREAEQLRVPVEVLSAQVLVDMLIDLRQQEGGLSAMLCSNERAQVSVLLKAARQLLTVGAFSPKHLWQNYWKAQPVLEVVYYLHAEKLLLLKDTLSESGVSVWLVAQLQSLCASRVTEEAEGEVRQQVLSTVVCELVRVGFHKVPDSADSAVSENCSSVLDHMLSWMLDSLVDTDNSQPEPAAGVWLCVYETSLFGALVSEDTLRGFFRHTLTHILTHQPRLRVSDAVAMQSQWSFAKAAPLLTSLFRKVCVLFSMEEVLVHLQQVLETLEVNWQNVLSCLSTLLVYHTHTQACLKEMLSRLLSSAFHTYDVEKMITAFLLARQGALEGLAVFPSYSDWFKMAFGGTSGYHGNSKKSLLFLMKFLSDLVPFDPPQYLKVHIMHPPYITGKHRALLQEYVSLAKTRLSDLKVSVDEMGLYEVVSGAVSEAQSQCPAQWDVEKAVTLFQSTGRIPATVMEASIFRRPYFLTRFLPVLLMPRVLPQEPDAKMAFIDALRKAEKIPASVFSSYSEACLRERQEGGTVLGDSLEKEGTPHVDVQTQLQQLRRLLTAGANEGDIRAQLSRLSQALGNVCPDSPEDQTNHTVIRLTLDLPTISHTVASVVDLVLRGFCQCVLDACRVSPPHRQGQWASMFLRMLVGQQKLYTALILRTFQLLHQGPSLAAAHVLGLAVFLVEMHACREVCPLVELLPCSLRSARMSPAEALSTALLSSTASHMQFSLRLSVAALCYARCRSISQREELNHWVPGRLHKQLLFLMPRLLPETRASVVTMVDGSVFSEGADEEECLSAWMSVTDSSGDVRSSVRAMWKHTAIRNLWSHPEHQLSFSEWLTAELKVQRSEDALSESERQVYERWVCLQWFLPLDVANGGCGGSSVTACKHIINAVLDTGLLSAPEHTHSCRVDVLSRLQELVWELEFVRIHRKTEREEGHFLWDLMAQRCSVTSDPENISIELELQRTLHTFNSVILALPAVVLVRVCAAGGRNPLDLKALMEHINNHQRRVCCPAAALSCSLTGHFLSAVFSASVKCDSPVEAANIALSQLSLKCPLLLVSVAHWWRRLSPMLCSLCERVMGEQPALIQLLRECHEWASRAAQGLSPAVPPAPPLLLAVCLHCALEQQGGSTEHIKANLTLSPERHKQVLVFLMFFYTTDLLSAHLRSQEEKIVSHAKDLSVHLLTLLVDSSDWLSLFHQSGSGQENVFQCVTMVTTDVNIRLMPFAFFSILAAAGGVLDRAVRVPRFLHTAVTLYVALLRLFLHGHTAPISSETLPLQLLARAQRIVLNSIQQSPISSLSHSQWSKVQADCEELDPEVGSALSMMLHASNPDLPPDLNPSLDAIFSSSRSFP